MDAQNRAVNAIFNKKTSNISLMYQFVSTEAPEIFAERH